MPPMARLLAVAVAVLAFAGGDIARAGTMLDRIAARGTLVCGLSVPAAPGFAARDAGNEWDGFDVDLCRAVAAAVTGDPAALQLRPLGRGERLAALRHGRVDLVAGMAWTLAHDLEVDVAAVTFFDGQGFLVPRALGVRSALELDGARICALAEDAAIGRLDAFFNGHLMEYVVLGFASEQAMFAGYGAGLCDAVTAVRARLAAGRRGLSDPEAHLPLPEFVAKAPRGLAVAAGEPAWGDVVRAVATLLLGAEEVQLDRAAIAADGPRPAAAERLLTAAAGLAGPLGLDPGWATRTLAAVGHYGELFERHLGEGTPVGLERGLNALWRDGGLHYPPPLR